MKRLPYHLGNLALVPKSSAETQLVKTQPTRLIFVDDTLLDGAETDGIFIGRRQQTFQGTGKDIQIGNNNADPLTITGGLTHFLGAIIVDNLDADSVLTNCLAVGYGAIDTLFGFVSPYVNLNFIGAGADAVFGTQQNNTIAIGKSNQGGDVILRGNVKAGSLGPNTDTQATVVGSISGFLDYSEPFQNEAPSEHVIVLYVRALVGTASYAYNVTFYDAPLVLGAKKDLVTAIAFNSVTVTGDGTSGWIILQGL